jgi:tetratricopeptide (TPR) repeat protein
VNYFFSEEELSFNASLNAWDLLVQMGFNESALYREGTTIRLFCPLHRDQIRRSLIVYTDRNTYKCQYTSCEGHKGGNLLEFYAAHMGLEIPEVIDHIRNKGASDTDLIERADKLIQEGELVDALPLLQKAVQLDPKHEISRCRLAALYLELGDKEAGYREYMTAAEQYGVRGELDLTLSIYNILVIISPDDVKVRKQLSYLFSRLGRQDEAVAQLKWVVDRHIRKGEFQEAAHMCDKMIELCPEYPDSYRILGEIMLKQGNYFEAVEKLRTATQYFVGENNLKKAKETVDLGLRCSPGNPAMKDLKAKIEKAIELQAAAGEQRDEKDVEYEEWLRTLKASIGLSETAEPTPRPPAAAKAAPEKPAKPEPAAKPAVARPAKPPAGERPAAKTAPPPTEEIPAAPKKKPAAPEKPATAEIPTATAEVPPPTRAAVAPAAPAKPAPAAAKPAATAKAVPPDAKTPPARPITQTGQLPIIPADDPRIAMCRDNLKTKTPEELESLQAHVKGMLNDVQEGFKDGHMSEWEVHVVREFYAAFCLALDEHVHSSGTES